MATITFTKRNKKTIMTMISSSLRCISATITSSSHDNYNGRNSSSSSSSIINDRFNKNNFICCCATTVRYASNNSTTTIKHQNILYTSQLGDTAGHMVGSSIEKPIRKNKEHVIIKFFRHFKNQWLEETGHSWPSKCSTKGCSNEPTVGAHIFIHKREYAYLVPMCHKCNMTPMKNFIPIETIDERSRFPFHLDIGTACVELTHIHISKQTYIIIDRPAWQEMSKRFIAYSKKHNSPLVPYRYKPDPELGKWVTTQRVRYKSNTIPQYQVELLEANGFVWDVLEYQWDENFKLLLKYQDREGHCNVHTIHKEDGNNLGTWVTNQRTRYKKNSLTQHQIELLEANGFVWDTGEYKWDEWFTLLVKFKKREGHCNVPRNHKEDGKYLGDWLTTQRQDMKNGKLDNIKEHRLVELGVVWELLKYEWDTNIILLAKYKHREGHCNVSRHHKENGANLGDWLNTQRQNERNGRLTTVKEKQLEKLGFIWEPLSDRWEEMYTLLATYKHREGHCNVLWNHEEEGKRLGRWVYKQHYNKRDGKLSEDRQHRLEEIGVIFLMFPGSE